MSPEQQRIKIAEACGKKYERVCDGHPAWECDETCGKMALDALPDYLNDLNAMHEAEKVLFPKLEMEYFDNLSEVTAHESIFNRWNFVHATSAQRAEAFLKCLGLWCDDASNLSTVATDTVKTSR